MFRNNRWSRLEDHELLDPYPNPISDQGVYGRPSEAENPDELGTHRPQATLGVPQISQRLWNSDYVTTLSCLLCFALALATVFHAPLALALGQVNQLIVLGVLLQLMALCTQSQIRYFLLVAECLWNKSSLQNFESIMQVSFYGPRISWYLRIAILFYLSLPVGLGVAYKRFTGGVTASSNTTEVGWYGMTGPPGTSNYGKTGMALFVNATLEWWTTSSSENVSSNESGVYGFNLNVESTDRTALLDGPTPQYVLQLQRKMLPGDHMFVDAIVNATVAEMVIDLNDTAKSTGLDFWYKDSSSWYSDPILCSKWNQTGNFTSEKPIDQTNDYWNSYVNSPHVSHDLSVSGDNQAWCVFGMIIPLNTNCWIWNNSFIMTSRWCPRFNETFGQYAQGYRITRQQYYARWYVTTSMVQLDFAEAVPNGTLTDYNAQILFGSNWLSLQDIYPRLFIDYDWKYVDNHAGPDEQPGKSTVHLPNIKSDTTLVATMAWSRVTSLDGLGNPYYMDYILNGNSSEYMSDLMYPTKSTFYVVRPTLNRSRLLALVLAVNPAILMYILILRTLFLKDAPISKDFGFITLLAAIEPEGLDLLKGASYSGKLERDVSLKFAVHDEDEHDPNTSTESSQASIRSGKITVRAELPHKKRLGASAHVDRVKKRQLYA